MPMTLSTPARNAVLDDVVAPRLAGGSLVLLDAANVILGSVALATPAFTPAADGASALRAVPEFTIATAGTVVRAEFRSAGGAAVLSGDVTLEGGGGLLTLPSLVLPRGLIMRLNGLPLTMPASA